MQTKKNVVILGAGFGGIRAAVVMAKRIGAMHLLDRYEIILVDRNDHHTYTPLLYEVATTSKETADVAHLHAMATHDIRTLVRNLPITFIKNTVERVDVIHGDVHFDSGARLSWDYLVLALGSEVNYFGIKGLSQYALPLKTFRDAIAIRDAIWDVALSRRGAIRIVVGGGGPTGVELAGELDAWCGELKDRFPTCSLHITLVEAGPSILGGFAPRIVALAKRRLATLGIKVIENSPIARAHKNSAVLESGRTIPFDVLAWTGGVKAPSLVSALQLKTEPRGHIEVSERMECISVRAYPQTPYSARTPISSAASPSPLLDVPHGTPSSRFGSFARSSRHGATKEGLRIGSRPDLALHGKIYALGDSVCFTDPVTKKPVAGVARAALSHANVVALNIAEDIKKDVNPRYLPLHRTYHPLEYPYVIPIGGKYAVAKLGPLIISGFFGWILKGLVELNYLFSLMPISYALMTWWRGLRAFMQNDRLG